MEVAYRLYGEAPKDDSVRTVTFGPHTHDRLTDWFAKKKRARQEWGTAWVDSEHVWTHENGEPLHPDWISRRLKRLVELSGLPPVRLHDLRHISASLSLLQGHDIKVVQERLGHASRQLTSDTYTSVLPELARREVEALEAAVPRAVPFTVSKPLPHRSSHFSNGLTVLYAFASRTRDDTWTISLKAGSGERPLGTIKTAVGDQKKAGRAAVFWVQNHCKEADLRVMAVDVGTEQIPMSGKRQHPLVRFVIDSEPEGSLTGWNPAPDDPPAQVADGND
ncbi:site-specific integrase [Streptomyces varsoviensis]|uniref:tyrosine-type recombinase/integrase n=1 Tax=Streptomyces varsoviensis TaxID=67373 RepID=UPI003400805E